MIDYGGYHIYDYAANKIFTISNLETGQGGLFPHFTTSKELNNLIDKYLYDEETQYKYTKLAYQKVINKDTYNHRIYDLGKLIKERKWKNSIKMLENIRK